MKNLFKNLMLVAVAAMAFTACTETNDEVNAVSKITRYEFTANIADDTRSGFVEKEEGATAYKSEWFGGETLKLYVTDNSTYEEATTATISSKEGQFTLELTDAPESFSMTVLSPAESWANPLSCTIPTEQTPRENSVDPAAHLLRALNVPVINGVADINMTHMAAYGKMTVNAPDFAIKKVEVSFNGGQVYTINADNVQKNTFWFATQAIDAVTEFTVTAYDSEDNAITKTVDVVEAGKTLAFINGRVSTFSVSGLEAVVEPEEPFAQYIATGLSFNGDGDLVFVVDAYETFKVRLNRADRPNNTTIKEGEYAGINSSTVANGQFSVYQKIKGGYTEGWTSTKTTSTMTVEYVDGQYLIIVDYISAWEGSGEVGYKGVPNEWVVPGGESGGDEPEQPVALETPVVSSSVTGNEVVVSWSAINGAANYTVTLGSQSQTVDGTSVTFSNLEYSTSYTVSVVANPADTTANIASEAGTASFTTEAEPEQPGDGGVTVKYVQIFGSGYEYIRYYELTSGNDVIGFWMNNNKSSNTTMNDGTYTNNNGGLSKVAGNASIIYIDKNVIDGENKGGVQNTSKMVVSNNGGHIEFKLEYWDTSVQAFVIKEYVFDGTIQ